MSAERRKKGQRGFTLTELVVVCVVLTILAGVSFPLAKFSVRRAKEAELRTALRQMRFAIDDFKRFQLVGLIDNQDNELLGDGYPEDLETLVEGIELVGDASGKKHRFLRRIPVDPMTGEAEWGKRCFQDDWDSDSWCGDDLFDVYSLSGGVGLNGIPYSEW